MCHDVLPDCLVGRLRQDPPGEELVLRRIGTTLHHATGINFAHTRQRPQLTGAGGIEVQRLGRKRDWVRARRWRASPGRQHLGRGRGQARREAKGIRGEGKKPAGHGHSVFAAREPRHSTFAAQARVLGYRLRPVF